MTQVRLIARRRMARAYSLNRGSRFLRHYLFEVRVIEDGTEEKTHWIPGYEILSDLGVPLRSVKTSVKVLKGKLLIRCPSSGWISFLPEDWRLTQ